MKIVQINGSYGDSDSTGRTTKELHQWLIQNKHDSYVFAKSFNDSSKVDSHITLFSSSQDEKIHALLSRITGLQGYFSFFSTKKMLKEISKINPDLIVLRVLHGNCINFPLFYNYLSKNKIPLMLVLHDCWYYTGHCCYYSEVECEKWKYNCGNCASVHQWNVSWFFDRSTKCLKDKKKWAESVAKLAVVGVSNWITNEAKQSILSNANILQTIYNWIDLGIFYPRDTVAISEELKLHNKKVIFCVASGWSNKKGLDDIIFIAKELGDVQFIMAGSMSATVQLPTNVLFVGMISDINRLATLYALADLFLNPSVQETFGKTTAEAMSCGTPAIVYETTACKELVNDERGAVVELKNKEKLLDATKNILTVGKKAYTQNCIEFSKNNFDFQTNAKKYLECFEKLTGKTS